MSASVRPVGGTHASEEVYRSHIAAHGVSRSGTHVTAYRAFVRAFPSLDTWFSLALVERVHQLREGWDVRRASRKMRLHPYLHFLVGHGYAVLDWPWIIASGEHIYRVLKPPSAVRDEEQRFTERAAALGYGDGRGAQICRCVNIYISLARTVTAFDDSVAQAAKAVQDFDARPDRAAFFTDTGWATWRTQFRVDLHAFRDVGFHLGRTTCPPQITRRPKPSRFNVPPRMATVIATHGIFRQAQGTLPATIERFRSMLSHLADWLSTHHPAVESFGEVTRSHILEYMAGFAGALASRISRFSTLNVFFQDITAWDLEDSPSRPLIGHRDLPKPGMRVPRYIPADQLAKVLAAVRALECPYQRAALLTARWSGARKGEIRWLELDCLDRYPDGTARLRIPAGKTRTERLIPLHEEAAVALTALRPINAARRGLVDKHGHLARRLFIKGGRLLSAYYLFDGPLQTVASIAGIDVSGNGQALTAHRFRHTVGTEMAQGGARLHTIMKMLGHTSTGMTLVYAHISDVALCEDYQKVLSPGARIAGPIADLLRAGAMPQTSIDWIRMNFFKTELELGHCFRPPEEGPCECDLYLSCAKFVTTPEYAPRLRERRAKELLLVADARDRGFAREVERHQCTIRRIDELLCEMGEPVAVAGQDTRSELGGLLAIVPS